MIFAFSYCTQLVPYTRLEHCFSEKSTGKGRALSKNKILTKWWAKCTRRCGACHAFCVSISEVLYNIPNGTHIQPSKNLGRWSDVWAFQWSCTIYLTDTHSTKCIYYHLDQWVTIFSAINLYPGITLPTTTSSITFQIMSCTLGSPKNLLAIL